VERQELGQEVAKVKSPEKKEAKKVLKENRVSPLKDKKKVVGKQNCLFKKSP